MAGQTGTKVLTAVWANIKPGTRVRAATGGPLTQWSTVATITKVGEDVGANGIYRVVCMPLHPDDADVSLTFDRRGNADVWAEV